MDLAQGRPLERPRIVELLQEARGRTLMLVSSLDEEELTAQHDPLMSPIVWDLGHIAHFEEVWLLESVESDGPGGEGLRGLYDPFENPRSTRGELALPSRAEALEYMASIRRAVLSNLEGVDLDGDGPLLRDGFVFRMVLQHEYQHDETILQTLQLKKGRPYAAPRGIAVEAAGTRGAAGRGGAAPPPGTMIEVPGGRYGIGTDDRSAAYDNERPRHEVELEPFRIDATPVTNGEYLAFMEDGGYRNRELWTPEGWAWLGGEEVEAPKHWRRDGDRWRTRVMDRVREVDPRRPVCHVCWYEADAYARWAGKRLPTEFEWEVAATWDPATGARRRFPWGDAPPTQAVANVDVLAFDTAPVGTYPRNVSPLGCYGMIGDVWEWTATDFHGYPGYETFPYEEYSEAFFGSEYKVLRGGSWATRGGALRSTFRNWDFPLRRQIFAGFRCASDA